MTSAARMLLPSALSLLLLLPQVIPAGSQKCNFPDQYANGTRQLYASPMRRQMRSWYTTILGQYSPLTKQLVVVFKTPPWIESVAKFKVTMDACRISSSGAKPIYKEVNTTDLGLIHRAPGCNDSLIITIDIPTVQMEPSEFGLCLEVWENVNGDRMSGAMSPMHGACHVSLNPRPIGAGDAHRRQSLLPSHLADHLMQRYQLIPTDDCCLAYVGDFKDSIAEAAPSKLSKDGELLGVYYTGAVCLICVTSVLVSLMVLRAKAFASSVGCWREMTLRRRCSKFRPPPRAKNWGAAYEHLLTNCKSLSTGQQLANCKRY